MATLSRLLRPAAIAVFGGDWACNVVRQCRRMGYAGEIWPVHPSRTQVEGLPCFASVEQLPAAPDAAFVGVNREATIEVVRALSARAAGGAVCFAAGFSEAQAEDDGAASLQQRLLDAAGQMPILGPNCYGFVNYLDGAALWPDQHGGARVERGVAIVTQSSNIAINMTMQRRGLPIAYVVTAGNQAQRGVAAIAAELLRDPRVSALGLYVEGFDDLRAFERLAGIARELNKPLVALKAGRSAQAQAATVSHTASLAGGFAASEALLARFGIALVESIAVFLETLKVLHVAGPLRGRRLGSMSSSGGEAALIADAAVSRAVRFPALPAHTRDALARILGRLVRLANPLDYHTYIWGDLDSMRAIYGAMMDAGFDLTLLVLDIPRSDRCDISSFEPAVDCLIEAAQARAGERSRGAVAMVASLPENLPEAMAARLVGVGIVPLGGLEDALSAAAAAAVWLQQAAPPAPLLLAGAAAGEAPVALLDEAEARGRLQAAGVPFAAWRQAADANEAAAAAQALGFPVVLKAIGRAHKSDSGGVAVGLDCVQAVLDAAGRMTGAGDVAPPSGASVAAGASASQAGVTAPPLPRLARAARGLLVEGYVEGGIVELLVGVVRDPTGLFLLTLGVGGVDTELLQDRATVLLPASTQEIERALDRLRLAPRLRGYRGRPPVDMSALLAAVHALQQFVTRCAQTIQEVEINPLILRERDAVAVDVLIRTCTREHTHG